MENVDSDEQPPPEKKKRPLLNSLPSLMARHSPSSPDKPTVDASVLQYQNQNLVQQLDGQKHELHDLEIKIKGLKDEQASYDSMLITVNSLWNQLVDELILLGIRAGADPNRLQTLDHLDHSRGSVPLCLAEEVFLYRLLQTESIESNGSGEPFNSIKDAIAGRVSSTRKLMNNLEDTISSQTDELEKISQALQGKQSAEDAIIQLSEVDELMKEEAAHLHSVIDLLNLKHKDYVERIQTCSQSHSVDQSEINRLSGELEEIIGELEESRRKLVNLKMQKDAASGVHSPVPCVANGSLSPEKLADRNSRLRELKDSIEETKIVADDRLSELRDAQEDEMILSEQLQGFQDEMKDEKYVQSSRLYTLLNDQLQHWNTQVERYKGLTDSLQAERSSFMRRENEVNVKAESLDVSRNVINEAESKIEELENQLQTCILEKNEVEIKMEEVVQDSGREDIKTEFRVMGSALSKELGMVEGQLNRWKKTANEALTLREQAQMLKAILSEKTSENKRLADTCIERAEEIKSIKALIEKMQKEKLELQILLDMLGQQIYDNRGIMEIKESEHRAHSQAEHLRNALDEHGLELRIKAANDAEAAYQQRLSAAEAEIADLRGKLDASERDVFGEFPILPLLPLNPSFILTSSFSVTLRTEREGGRERERDNSLCIQNLPPKIERISASKMTNLLSFVVIIIAVSFILVSQAQVPKGSFEDNFNIMWSEDHFKTSQDGQIWYLSLDKKTGCGFQTKQRYRFGWFSMKMKLVGGDSAGVVTAYYMCSEDGAGPERDEVDFEFLGNRTGQPYLIQTNIYKNGTGGREMRHMLWFDPTEDYHSYSILWNSHLIAFYVDKVPIRVFKNADYENNFFPNQKPMYLFSSIWNADDWATRGGLEKTDWKKAPFVSSYKDFSVDACQWEDPYPACVSTTTQHWWDKYPAWHLSDEQKNNFAWVERNLVIYDYCKDSNRFSNLPEECLLSPWD